jgi:hypothetical protein
VPVRIEDCAPPGLLWTRVYIDLVGLDEQAAAERPRAGLGYGRAKPTGRRPYPGAPARAGAASFPGRRPAIFNVPPRNPHFAGRCDLLAMLRRHLTEKSTGAVVQAGAVHGLGGVGKTQLAIEYAHRYGADYDLVWWIRRNARRRRAAIVFWDEAGVSLVPVTRRTWGPRGRTPVIRHHFKLQRASMAAALCYGSGGGGAQLAFHHQPGAYDTDTLIGALEGCAASSVGRRRPCCGTGCPPTAANGCAAGCGASSTGWWWSHCPAMRSS